MGMGFVIVLENAIAKRGIVVMTVIKEAALMTVTDMESVALANCVTAVLAGLESHATFELVAMGAFTEAARRMGIVCASWDGGAKAARCVFATRYVIPTENVTRLESVNVILAGQGKLVQFLSVKKIVLDMVLAPKIIFVFVKTDSSRLTARVEYAKWVEVAMYVIIMVFVVMVNVYANQGGLGMDAKSTNAHLLRTRLELFEIAVDMVIVLRDLTDFVCVMKVFLAQYVQF
jgi:hypothetical protein